MIFVYRNMKMTKKYQNQMYYLPIRRYRLLLKLTSILSETLQMLKSKLHIYQKAFYKCFQLLEWHMQWTGNTEHCECTEYWWVKYQRWSDATHIWFSLDSKDNNEKMTNDWVTLHPVLANSHSLKTAQSHCAITLCNVFSPVHYRNR